MVHSTVSGVPTVTESRVEEWVEVGRVTRPRGFDGRLVVHLYGDAPGNLLRADVVTLNGEPGSVSFQVRRAEAVGGLRGGRVRVRLTLDGLDSRERAALWTGARVSIPERALQPLSEGEFYWRDLIGLRCRTDDGEELGVVEEIWPTGSNDVLVVRRGERTLLLPTLRSLLAGIDLEAGELRIERSSGLLEEN